MLAARYIAIAELSIPTTINQKGLCAWVHVLRHVMTLVQIDGRFQMSALIYRCRHLLITSGFALPINPNLCEEGGGKAILISGLNNFNKFYIFVFSGKS